MDKKMNRLLTTALFSLAFGSLEIGAAETPFTPFKDGYANTSQYIGTSKTLIVRAGDSKGWVAHSLGDSSSVGLSKARLSIYVKDVIKDGTLRVYFATSLNFLENQARYENLKASDSAGIINISAARDIQGMVSVPISSAILKKIKDGAFAGFILEGANGLDAEFGAIEGSHGALLYLSYENGLALNQAMIDTIAYTVATKHAGQITGAIGTRGPKGDTGAAGPAGPKGDVGPKGDAGALGPKGDVGPKGDSGAPGPKGDAGAAGPKGDVGLTGSKGDAGAQGLVGDAGPKGDVGPKGDPGDQGRQFQILSDRGYRARYEFNKFTGVSAQLSPDSSGFGNELTLSGGVVRTPVTPGELIVKDTALLFDGASGYASAPHDLSLSPYREISLLARVTITPGASDTNTILAKKNQFEMAIIGPTGNRNLKCRFKTILGGDWTWIGLGLVGENVWTNVQATYDGTGIRTFVNGVQMSFTRYPNGPLVIDTSTPLYIGAREPNLRGFLGKLDQIRILPFSTGSGDTRNIGRWQGISYDVTDNGALGGRTVNFQKWEAATGLRVTWSDNFRAFGNASSCRWEVLFNDLPCATPMGLVFDKYEGGTSSNRHDLGTVFGTCFINKTGPIKVSTRVNTPVPGGVVGDCHTGWWNQLVSFEVEEVP